MDIPIKLFNNKILDVDDSYNLCKYIIEFDNTTNNNDDIKKNILTYLHTKPESLNEIKGFINYIKHIQQPFKSLNKPFIDMSGTGGDLKKTINITTLSSFIIASSGLNVIKHCGSSLTSKYGSSNILNMLFDFDININKINKKWSNECYKKFGIAFLKSTDYNFSMNHINRIRKTINTPTIFNIIGPLTNPAGFNSNKVIGTYDKQTQKLITKYLQSINDITNKSIIIHSESGMDEFSCQGYTMIYEINGKNVIKYKVRPADFNLNEYDDSLLEINYNDENEYKNECIELLKGNHKNCAKSNSLILNAALGIYIGGKTDNLNDAVILSKRILYNGDAYALYKKMYSIL
jgi:anthranilate phosphoribosyltransferase